MALTHHLTVIKDSPVKAFLLDHLPNTRRVVSDHNKRLADAATVPLCDRAQAATIGAAIDYRIRYYFGAAGSEGDAVAEHGAALLTQEGYLSQASVGRFFAALDALTASLPVGVALSDPDEDVLCRYCLVLANLESAFLPGTNQPARPSTAGPVTRHGAIRLAVPLWTWRSGTDPSGRPSCKHPCGRTPAAA